MTAVIERRIAGIKSALDALSPPDDPLTRFKRDDPWFGWTSDSEIDELEAIYRAAEEGDGMPEADQAKVMAIIYASKARMLAGEPKAIDQPPPPYDIQASYERSKRALEAKGQ